MERDTIRQRLESALSGEIVRNPVYAVYDWFVNNRQFDWEILFGFGLGQINHANLVKHEHPNFDIIETKSEQDGQVRRDIRLITDKGELQEWYLGEWKQEHFIKESDDYKIMAHALEGVRVIPDEKDFLNSEAALGDRGITLGQLHGLGAGRTPLMILQIDWVGLERFSMDLAYDNPQLLYLVEVLNEIKLQEIREAIKTPATHIKLWENLSIDTLGPVYYRRYLLPLYEKILKIMNKAGKKLHVHYDGQLKAISEDIAKIDIDGIDSFTESPEGNMSTAEARDIWPEKFLWQNINLGWYEMSPEKLKKNIERVVKEAGNRRHCLMISEEVPLNCRETVPFILEVINSLS